MILLSHEVIVFLFVETLLLLLQAIAFVSALGILKSWNFSATSSHQYALEKRAYLVVLIIVVTLGIKIVLLPFFSHTIDTLSLIVPGAMCGAGVITANAYGPLLLGLKVLIIFMTGIWLILNSQDLNAPDYPWFKPKIWLFLLIFTAVLIEYVLDLLYFLNISTSTPVMCCSTIYGASGGSNALPLGLDTFSLLLLFYLFYALSMVAGFSRYAWLNFIANFLFLVSAYYSVVYFFGTYVYELPTHKCPFCMLQKEYFYSGYLIWGSLFIGTFFGMAGAVLRLVMKKEVGYTYRYSVIFNTIFVLLCSLYVGSYYLKNGVWL